MPLGAAEASSPLPEAGERTGACLEGDTIGLLGLLLAGLANTAGGTLDSAAATPLPTPPPTSRSAAAAATALEAGEDEGDTAEAAAPCGLPLIADACRWLLL